MMRTTALLLGAISTAAAQCTPAGFTSGVVQVGTTEATICVKLNAYDSETGYYHFEGETGPSPAITVKIGDTITFDQRDSTNWYHPIGFAYEPDGAHGSTWGGAELPEVEGAGELLYKIDGAATTCPDAGDTGLDCYEPEFFYPRSAWSEKVYTAELTITQAMADASRGGVLYYFCHIHSKMSGKIIIQNADGSAVTQADGSALAITAELDLYAPSTIDAFDTACGTSSASGFQRQDGDANKCPGSDPYVSGVGDPSGFEECLHAIDCKMTTEMRVLGHDTHTDDLVTFVQQMIPHHANAVNMAKLIMKMAPNAVAAVEDLEDILWDIVNVQNFQIHQFRNYLAGHATYTNTDGPDGGKLGAESLGHHCEDSLESSDVLTITGTAPAATPGADVADCTPSATNICASVDIHAGDTGYYKFEGHTGASPAITVKIGDTITFDQRDSTNWYHPIGFAYEPDGAHGSTWGGAELPEVEGAGELLYKIDGVATTCPDAGDTGLDCYEPEFFYPRSAWSEKVYTAELTITQAMADASRGGVLYYFCHIHSKMSGKITIQNADGTAYTSSTSELALYEPTTISGVDGVCGTATIAEYAGGALKACDEAYLCGDIDTDFERCMQAVDCKMKTDMKDGTDPLPATPSEADYLVAFMQQMIPHHQNAVEQAKIALKFDLADIQAVEDMEDIVHSIINVQNFQIHQFRNYLGGIKDVVATAADTPSDPEAKTSNAVFAYSAPVAAVLFAGTAVALL